MMSSESRLLAVGLLLACVVAAAVARPAEPTASDAMPSTTLLAQDLDLMALQTGPLVNPPVTKLTNQQDRPPRASPLAHIIADIIDIKYQVGRAFLSRFFSLFPGKQQG